MRTTKGRVAMGIRKPEETGMVTNEGKNQAEGQVRNVFPELREKHGERTEKRGWV